MVKRVLCLAALAIVSAAMVSVACTASTSGSGSDAATTGDADDADHFGGDATVICEALPCASPQLDLHSTCGWTGITTTCAGGASCHDMDCRVMNTGTSQSCTIHATAADGTVFDLQYTYFAGGCNQCPSLTVRSSRPPTDGGDLPDYIGHICRDAGSTDAATD